MNASQDGIVAGRTDPDHETFVERSPWCDVERRERRVEVSVQEALQPNIMRDQSRLAEGRKRVI